MNDAQDLVHQATISAAIQDATGKLVAEASTEGVTGGE